MRADMTVEGTTCLRCGHGKDRHISGGKCTIQFAVREAFTADITPPTGALMKTITCDCAGFQTIVTTARYAALYAAALKGQP